MMREEFLSGEAVRLNQVVPKEAEKLGELCPPNPHFVRVRAYTLDRCSTLDPHCAQVRA